METRQQRYEQTEKGRAARKKAIANYRAKLVKWEVMLDQDLSDALEQRKPEGMSRSAYLKTIFQKHLDNVGMQDTY